MLFRSLEQYASPPVEKVESLEDTGREDGGFGLTGVTEQDLLIRFIDEHRTGPTQVPLYLAKDNNLYEPEKRKEYLTYKQFHPGHNRWLKKYSPDEQRLMFLGRKRRESLRKVSNKAQEFAQASIEQPKTKEEIVPQELHEFQIGRAHV